MATEKEFVDKLELVFNKYFTVNREVRSKSGKDRIDIIVITDNGEAFGIECKRPNKKKGAEMFKYVEQAIRYKDAEFPIKGEYKRIPIFIAPPLSYNYFILNEETQVIDGIEWHKDRHNKDHDHHSMNGFLGGLGIGEVRVQGADFHFSFSNKFIWKSEKRYNPNSPKGLHKVNYDKLLKKLGI